MKDPLPSDFDWVTDRLGCSADKVFERLRLEAESNVKTFNNKSGNAPWMFASHGSMFSVSRRHFSGTVGVRFELAGDEIRAEGHSVEPAIRLTATLTLNDEGECRLLVGKTELDRWQFLKRALEPLLFGPERL